MGSLKENALHYSKLDVTALPVLDLTLEIKEATFKNATGQDVRWNYVEIDGKKYTIKAAIMGKINDLLGVRPATTKVKVNKGSDGQISVIPLD